MELIVDADFPYILASSATRIPFAYFATSSFLNSIVFLIFFIKGLAHETVSMVAYLAVALNKQAQKALDYYKMFRINAQGDTHSTRNKGIPCVFTNTWDA